jgi:PKD domain-containing protein
MPRAGSAQYRPKLTVLVTVTAACLLFAQGAAAAVTTIGGPGVGPGTFAVPGADALDSAGALYVLDPFRGTLQKFSNEGGFAEEVEQANGLPLPTDNVAGIAIDAANRVFVADPSNKRLIELNSSLGYEATIAGGVEPIAVATGDGFIYTLSVNAGQYRIQQYVDNPPTFTVGVSRTFATGSGPEDLAAPNANGAIHDQLAVDADGTVYVTDADNQRVIELNDALNVLPNRLTGISGYALAIATGQVAGETQVYVGDDNYAGSAYVRRYSPSGALLGSFAVPGAHGGLATDASGDVFDSEGFANGDVLRIDTTPDPAIAATPASGLTSQTVTFSGAGSETDLWGVADYSWSLEGSSGFPTDTLTSPTVERQFNAPGTYPISLQVTATNRRVAQTTVDYVVGNSGAAFTSPIHALTGTPVSFDGSASAIPYSKVTDYAWDFDGSSNYADDGGTAPTISHTFTTPGTYTVQLRVTRAGGRVDLAAHGRAATAAGDRRRVDRRRRLRDRRPARAGGPRVAELRDAGADFKRRRLRRRRWHEHAGAGFAAAVDARADGARAAAQDGVRALPRRRHRHAELHRRHHPRPDPADAGIGTAARRRGRRSGVARPRRPPHLQDQGRRPRQARRRVRGGRLRA